MSKGTIVVSKDKTIIELGEPIEVACPKCNAPLYIKEIELPDDSRDLTDDTDLRVAVRCKCEDCKTKFTVKLELSGFRFAPTPDSKPAN